MSEKNNPKRFVVPQSLIKDIEWSTDTMMQTVIDAYLEKHGEEFWETLFHDMRFYLQSKDGASICMFHGLGDMKSDETERDVSLGGLVDELIESLNDPELDADYLADEIKDATKIANDFEKLAKRLRNGIAAMLKERAKL